VPAAAVIPAPVAYIKVVAVKKLVVGFRSKKAAVPAKGRGRPRDFLVWGAKGACRRPSLVCESSLRGASPAGGGRGGASLLWTGPFAPFSPGAVACALSRVLPGAVMTHAIPWGSVSVGCSPTLFTERGFSTPLRPPRRTGRLVRRVPEKGRICRRRPRIKSPRARGPPESLAARAGRRTRARRSAQSSNPFTLNKLECSKQAKPGVKLRERLA